MEERRGRFLRPGRLVERFLRTDSGGTKDRVVDGEERGAGEAEPQRPSGAVATAPQLGAVRKYFGAVRAYFVCVRKYFGALLPQLGAVR